MDEIISTSLNEILKDVCVCSFFSPTSSGKTYNALKLFHSHSRNLIFISPLRSILLEVYYTFDPEIIKNIFYHESSGQNPDLIQWLKMNKSSNSNFLLLSTPELINEDILLRAKQHPTPIVVLDEFHLFFYWGESFRPKLVECLFLLLNLKFPILGMTATFSERLKNELKALLEHESYPYYQLELGQGAKYLPSQHLFFSPILFSDLKFLIFDRIKRKQFPILIFCPYREQVLQLSAQLRDEHLSVLHCIGGESLDFYQKLKLHSNVEVIIATSVLGHGVNLPEIRTVILSYTEENPDIRTQMIGRGGRKGSNFTVLESNFKHFSLSKKIFDFILVKALIVRQKLIYGIAIRWINPVKTALSGQASTLQNTTEKRSEDKSYFLWRARWGNQK